ncbi:hypothetical protein [Lysobacter sp. CA199]|uniref:hypothetical protein n=1 Tax=Lysobacter sp. CA199 TaxID=3455608 RepID=UPI003F8D3BAC
MSQIFNAPVGQAAGRDINNVDVHHHSLHAWQAMDGQELAEELRIKRKSLRTVQYRYWMNPQIWTPIGAGMFIGWAILMRLAEAQPQDLMFLLLLIPVLAYVVWDRVRHLCKQERSAILRFQDDIALIENELYCRNVERQHRRRA